MFLMWALLIQLLFHGYWSPYTSVMGKLLILVICSYTVVEDAFDAGRGKTKCSLHLEESSGAEQCSSL